MAGFNGQKVEAVEVVRAEAPQGAEGQGGEYRTPQVFPIGEAADLVRASLTGSKRDGYSNWYVWGS
jgi:hypothetical protein